MRKPRGPNRERQVTCLGCASEFMTRHSQGKYCSGECQRESWRRQWREYGARNTERRTSYGAQYYDGNKEQICARTNAYSKTPAGRSAIQKTGARARELFPEKIAARSAVSVALRAGKITRERCACGKGRAQAHHPDYSKPLEVVWLCTECHAALHKQERRAAKGVAA